MSKKILDFFKGSYRANRFLSKSGRSKSSIKPCTKVNAEVDTHNRNKMRGFTMIEILGVVVIIAVIASMGAYSLTNNLEDSRNDIVYTEQSVFAADLEKMMQDNGVLYIPTVEDPDDPSTPAYQAEMAERTRLVKNFINQLESNYLHCYLDLNTLHVTPNYFSIDTSGTLDPWEMPYRLIYYIEYGGVVGGDKSTASRTPGDAMVISGGENASIDLSGYKDLNFSDDKILFVDAKDTQWD